MAQFEWPMVFVVSTNFCWDQFVSINDLAMAIGEGLSPFPAHLRFLIDNYAITR